MLCCQTVRMARVCSRQFYNQRVTPRLRQPTEASVRLCNDDQSYRPPTDFRDRQPTDIRDRSPTDIRDGTPRDFHHMDDSNDLDLTPSRRSRTRITKPVDFHLNDTNDPDLQPFQGSRGRIRITKPVEIHERSTVRNDRSDRLHGDDKTDFDLKPQRSRERITKPVGTSGSRYESIKGNYDRGDRPHRGVHMDDREDYDLQSFERSRERITNPIGMRRSRSPKRNPGLKRKSVETSYPKNDGLVYNHGMSGRGKGLSFNTPALPHIAGEVVFGLHPVLLTLESGRRQVTRLYVKQQLLEQPSPVIEDVLRAARGAGVPIQAANKTQLDALAQNRPHQGVCLDASPLGYQMIEDEVFRINDESVEAGTIESRRLWLLLDSVQDPMNLGAVIRSAYYLGVDKLIVTEENSCPASPVVSKASAGTLEVWPVYSVKGVHNFAKTVSSHGWRVIGAVGLNKHNNVRPLNAVSKMDQNTLLMIGNEGSGLSVELLAACDELVTLTPGREVHRGLDSLNVSVATGILLHSLLHGN